MKTCKFCHTEKPQSWPAVTPDRWDSSVTRYPNKAPEPVTATLRGHKAPGALLLLWLKHPQWQAGQAASRSRLWAAAPELSKAEDVAGIFDTAAFLLLVFTIQAYPRHLKLLKATISAIDTVLSNWALQTAEATPEHFLLSTCRNTISVLKCYGLAIPISLLVPLQQIAIPQCWPTFAALNSTRTTAISKWLSAPRIFIVLFQMV